MKIKKWLRRWLGIVELDAQLESMLKHYGVKLERQPKYKVVEPKEVGFKGGDET